MNCSLILSIRIEFALTISLQSSHTSLMISFVMHQRYLLGKLFVFVHIPRVCVFNSLALVRTSNSPWLRLFFGTDMFSFLPHMSVRIVRLCDYEGWGDSVAAEGTVVVVRTSRTDTTHKAGVANARRP